MSEQTLEEWKVEQKKNAYLGYVDGQWGADEFHVRIKYIDEI